MFIATKSASPPITSLQQNVVNTHLGNIMPVGTDCNLQSLALLYCHIIKIYLSQNKRSTQYYQG